MIKNQILLDFSVVKRITKIDLFWLEFPSFQKVLFDELKYQG